MNSPEKPSEATPRGERTPRWWRGLAHWQAVLAQANSPLHLAGLGILCGVCASVTIVAFRGSVEFLLALLLPGGDPENFEALQHSARIALPIAGALLLGLLMLVLPAAWRSAGVAHVIDRLHNHCGRLPVGNFLFQFAGGLLALVSGQSSGREGPAVHLGAATNSLLGQALKLPNNSLHLMVGCGTAAAIGAAFNTPLAGVILAMEVVVMEYTIAGFMPIILAAASAALISTAVYGSEPAFTVPAAALSSLWDLVLAIPLGLAAGAAAALFIRIQSGSERRLAGLNIVARIGLAGLVTGLVAALLPQVMGIGYDTLNIALAGQLGAGLLVLIALGKLVLTAFSSGAGMPIGIIGPSLLIGGCLGGALWQVSALLPIDIDSDGSVFVLLGMGATMGALLNAPLAALAALLELSGNPQILMPAMVTIIVANLSTRVLFGHQSVYLHSLRARGVRISSSPVRRTLQQAAVSAVIDRSYLRRQAPLPLSQLPPAKAARWLVLEREGELFLFDLPRIQAILLSEEYRRPQLDLLESELPRRAIARIDVHASLREAWELMRRDDCSAVFVSGAVGGLPLSGVVTQERVEDFYLNRDVD